MQLPKLKHKGKRKRNPKRMRDSSSIPFSQENKNRFHKNRHPEEEEEEEEGEEGAGTPAMRDFDESICQENRDLFIGAMKNSSSNPFPKENKNQFHKNPNEEERTPAIRDFDKSKMCQKLRNLCVRDAGAGEEEDDDDVVLQLALLHSLFAFTTQEDIAPEIIDHKRKDMAEVIDHKRKGIAEQPITPLPDQWELRNHYSQTTGESSVTQCVICKETTSSGSVLRSNNECRHPFCEDCIRNYIGEKLQENIHIINCPEEECNQELEQSIWKQFVPERLGWLREQAIIEGSVLAYPCVFRCPNKDCLEIIVDDKKKFLIKACPNCWKIFCSECLVPWHQGGSCYEYKIWRSLERLRQLFSVFNYKMDRLWDSQVSR